MDVSPGLNTASTESNPLPPAPPKPQSNWGDPPPARGGSGINSRILLLIGVFALLIGSVAWVQVRMWLTHGISDHGQYAEVDLKSLGFFDFNPYSGTIEDVPRHYRKLDGRRIVLVGEIYDPDNAGERLTGEFQLVYSIAKCCFGGPPKVQERVFGFVPSGRRLYKPESRLARMTGTLHITMKRDPASGEVVEIYRLDVEKVDPA